jgi:hypothetical protein
MGSHGLLGDATATPLDMIIDDYGDSNGSVTVSKSIYLCSEEAERKINWKMSSGEKP